MIRRRPALVRRADETDISRALVSRVAASQATTIGMLALTVLLLAAVVSSLVRERLEAGR